MLRHFHNFINYPRLIELQAKGVETKLQQEQSKKLKTCLQPKQVKRKSYNLYNGVTRHH